MLEAGADVDKGNPFAGTWKMETRVSEPISPHPHSVGAEVSVPRDREHNKETPGGAAKFPTCR